MQDAEPGDPNHLACCCTKDLLVACPCEQDGSNKDTMQMLGLRAAVRTAAPFLTNADGCTTASLVDLSYMLQLTASTGVCTETDNKLSTAQLLLCTTDA